MVAISGFRAYNLINIGYRIYRRIIKEAKSIYRCCDHLGQERYEGGAPCCQGALGPIGQHITISDEALHIMDSDELLLLPI